MLVLIALWFGFFIIYKSKKQNKNLSHKENQALNIVVFSYPFIEIFIKYFLMNTTIYCYEIINRFEHFLFAFFLMILLLPSLKPTINKLNFLESLLFSVCLIVFIGNINELIEYIIRLRMNLLATNFYEKVYYADTIIDICINTLGGLTGFLFLKKLK